MSSRREDERGSSVVEFVMVSTLLLFLLFAVVQVAVYAYVRNIAAAAAADGARYAASSGVDPAAGAQRADDVMRAALLSGAVNRSCDGTAGVDATSLLRVVTVECSGTVRSIFLPVGALLPIRVRSSALRELP